MNKVYFEPVSEREPHQIDLACLDMGSIRNKYVGLSTFRVLCKTKKAAAVLCRLNRVSQRVVGTELVFLSQ